MTKISNIQSALERKDEEHENQLRALRQQHERIKILQRTRSGQRQTSRDKKNVKGSQRNGAQVDSNAVVDERETSEPSHVSCMGTWSSIYLLVQRIFFTFPP